MKLNTMVIPTEQEIESLKARVDESKVTTFVTKNWGHAYRDQAVRIYVCRFEFMGTELQIPLAYDSEFGEWVVVMLPSHFACMELVTREKLGGHEFLIIRERVTEIAMKHIMHIKEFEFYTPD